MRPETGQTTLLRLLDQYKPALWRLVNAYEADLSRREDLFQEIALGLWQAIPRFRGDSSERTWLYRIAHNIAISAMIARRRREFKETSMDYADRATTAEHPDQSLLLDERRQALLTAIRELPATDKQLILLHLEELSYREIEEVSGLSESAIASRLSRIRDRLSEVIRRKEIRK